MANSFSTTGFEYELVDCGEARKLERFNHMVVDRPAPQALWDKKVPQAQWKSSHLRYKRNPQGESGWVSQPPSFPQALKIGDVAIELRLANQGQLGIFPEQWPNWLWLQQSLSRIKKKASLLNGFAHTGVATLMASAAHEDIEVCHVDAAKASVNWARHNAKISGLEDRPIRWMVEDILKFLHREIKRGKKYDGFILDPPAFGRGAGRKWEIQKDLPKLMECVSDLLSDDPLFVILSCHSSEIRKSDLAHHLKKMPGFKKKSPETSDLIIPSSLGNSLPCGISARISNL